MEQQRLSDPQADKVCSTNNTPLFCSKCGCLNILGLPVIMVYSVLRGSFHNFQMRVRKITPKVLQLLTEWTETFPYDFRDERMMRSLKELTHRLASGDEVSA